MEATARRAAVRLHHHRFRILRICVCPAGAGKTSAVQNPDSGARPIFPSRTLSEPAAALSANAGWLERDLSVDSFARNPQWPVHQVAARHGALLRRPFDHVERMVSAPNPEGNGWLA